jgi:hypothetical protein
MPRATAAQLAQQTVAQLQAILGQANLQHPAAAFQALPQGYTVYLYDPGLRVRLRCMPLVRLPLLLL